MELLRVFHQRQLNKAGLIRGVVNTLCGFVVVGGLGPENIGHKGLRIAVVEREPARLDLHHDAVARKENMIRGREIKFVEKWFVRGEGLDRKSTRLNSSHMS